jgi:hypothetical protein
MVPTTFSWSRIDGPTITIKFFDEPLKVADLIKSAR